MKTISFGSIKGGTGKSSTLILIARAIAKNGGKVLLIDSDINNSTSFTFMPSNKEQQDPNSRKHLAAALQSDNLKDYILESNYKNIDIIISSLYLVDLRTININRLKNLIKESNLDYDYCLIDTAPTYDNLTLMAYEASDIVITPILFTQFDFNTTVFLENKLKLETSVYNNWYIIFNQAKTDSVSQNEYKELFKSYFGSHLMNTSIPSTMAVRNCIDRNELIGKAKSIEKLRTSICTIASDITGEIINPQEAF